MARMGRKQSGTGIYHIMLRGIDKREIFLDDEDREVFIRYLVKARDKSSCAVYGYCLMDNHIHLLIEEGHEHIGESIKRITVGYVYWHNLKYSRIGHLFQNRYRSETVEDDTYFLTVLRYIHQNPIKAGIVNNIADYKWSSYINYIEGYEPDLVSLDRGKSYFASLDEFKEFMNMSTSDRCLEHEVKIKYTDKNLKNEIVKFYDNPDLITDLSKKERDNVIKEIKKNTGASNRQLSRVLGIGRGIVERI